jgi:hypothetical protein
MNVDKPCAPEPIQIQPGQYVQAGMAYWTNLNTTIWQQVVLLVTIQTAASGGGYALRGSWTSVLLIAAACLLSLGFVRSIISSIRVRTALLRQLNFFAAQALEQYLRGRTLPEGTNRDFVFHDECEDDQNLLNRNFSGAMVLGSAIIVFDCVLAIAFNWPHWVEKAIPDLQMLGLPVFPKPSP